MKKFLASLPVLALVAFAGGGPQVASVIARAPAPAPASERSASTDVPVNVTVPAAPVEHATGVTSSDASSGSADVRSAQAPTGTRTIFVSDPPATSEPGDACDAIDSISEREECREDLRGDERRHRDDESLFGEDGLFGEEGIFGDEGLLRENRHRDRDN